MNQEKRFADLWADYLEGELDEVCLAELRELLAHSESLLKQAADLFQLHRMLGLVAAENSANQEEFVHETLVRLPVGGERFVAGIMEKIHRSIANRGVPKNQLVYRPATAWTRLRFSFAVSTLLGAIALGCWLWPGGATHVVSHSELATNAPITAEPNSVRLASQSHARFFGKDALPVGAKLASEREYVLTNGLIELTFPAGASAVIEGPAVFRILSEESLTLDIGRCSVHAPTGAEGFRVETPVTRVIDRGTRFTVDVSELMETEVHVIEGAADIYEQSQSASGADKTPIRLVNGKAQRYTRIDEFAADAISFNPQVYRRTLPDRVIAYTASAGKNGGVKDLLSLTVQRGGRVIEYPVSELIPSEVGWFKSSANGFLCGDKELPPVRRITALDWSLNSGIINPGGNEAPLSGDPVMNNDHGTPGMAVRFRQPVTNGPGADVVLFDIQMFANPPEGDAFHVSPLQFRDGLHSHTVRVYDLTIESPAALEVEDFYLQIFDDPVNSLDELESLRCTPQLQTFRFRALAVGIDLSDLGYRDGETVAGLFIQDDLSDRYYVDPVLIVGLPESVQPARSDRTD